MREITFRWLAARRRHRNVKKDAPKKKSTLTAKFAVSGRCVIHRLRKSS